MEKLRVCPPVIAIEQKTTTKNPRSTVGTITEVYDYLRLLYARIGIAHSKVTGKEMVSYSEDEIVSLILKKHINKKIKIFGPIVKSRKGSYRDLFSSLKRQGFEQVRIDDVLHDISPGMEVDRYKNHNIEVLVDYLTINQNENTIERLKNSVSVALSSGNNSLLVNDNEKFSYYSRNLICLDSGISYEIPEPNSFSFNSPYGMCKGCKGLGTLNIVNVDSIIPDFNKTIYNGGIEPVGSFKNNWIFKQLEYISNKFNFSLKDKIKDIPKEAIDVILYGSKENSKVVSKSLGLTRTYSIDFEGIVNFISNQFNESHSRKIKAWASNYMNKENCKTCNGKRLKEESLYFKILKKRYQ